MTSFDSINKKKENVVDLLSATQNERILDIGCGEGHLTKKISGEKIEVVGIDKSKEKIYKAKKNYPNITFICADAREFKFKKTFDAVFSNSALHWIKDQDSVLKNISSVLEKNDRFVAEMGGNGNIATIIQAVRDEMENRGYKISNPWYFPSVGEYTPKLENHGFEVRYAALFDHTIKLKKGEKGLERWFKKFGDKLFESIPPREKTSIILSIKRRLRPYLFQDGSWFADYRRLRFLAIKN